MRKKLVLFVITVVCAGIILVSLTVAFPIVMRFPDLVLRNESSAALLEWVDYIYYTHVLLGALEWNPERGIKEFAPAIEAAERAPKPDHLEIGKLEWHRGDFRAAVSHLETHHRLHGESESSLFWLAMSYLRLAEADNCLAELTGPHAAHEAHDHNAMCTLPLTRYHEDSSLSRQSAAVFEKLLDDYDVENRLYQWLLNFSYMTVDAFPEEVPERYLVRSAFIDLFYGAGRQAAEKEYAYLSFEDRARELGVDTLDAGKGVAVEDFDRDGYLDIVTGGTFAPMRYYRNQEGRRFVDLSHESKISEIKGTHIMSAADFDNDGWMDVFVSRPMGSERGDYVLLRNQGDGTFKDVTTEMGLLPRRDEDDLYTLTWASAWGDIDNDGDLDLFVANWGFYTAVGADDRLNPLANNRGCILYRNDGDRFVDVTEASGLAKIIWDRNVFGAAFGDYDNDGHLDLAFTPQWIPGLALARNTGGGRFEATDLIDSRSWGFMTSFVDVNHDGRLDLYAGSTGTALGITKQAVFGEDLDRYGNDSSLWLQTEDGRFESRPEFFPGGMPLATMGTNFGDINNDGAYDFYVGTGNPEGWMVLPHMMYIGVKEGGRVTGQTANISMLEGFGTIQKGHGIVFFDFDEDGDQDIYSSLGGLWPADVWPNQFFVNDSDLAGTWTKIRLRGRRSNYYGLGARIRVTVANQAGESRTHHYYMDNKTGFGSAPYLAHLGLDDAVEIRRVEVTWPGGQTPRVYTAQLEATNLLDEDGSSSVIKRGKGQESGPTADSPAGTDGGPPRSRLTGGP